MNWLDKVRRKRRRPGRGNELEGSGTSPVFDFPIVGPEWIARVTGISQGGRARSGGAMVRIDYFGADGQRVPGPYRGLKHTRQHGHHLRFASGPDQVPFNFYLTPPSPATRLVMTFRGAQSREVVFDGVVLEWLDPSLDPSPVDGDPAMLKIVQRQMFGKGEVSVAAKLAQTVYVATGTPSDKRALDRARGIVRELDTTWAPAIPETLRLARPVRRNLVCHLFKVTYPHENSGGAIRGLNLVSSLAAVGYDSLVLTPLFYPPEPQAERRTVMDGVTYYNLALPGGPAEDAPLDARLEYDALLTASIVAQEAPAIIHAASGYRGYELALKALPIGARLGIPVIYEVRSFHEHLWGASGSTESEWTRLRMAQEERCMREAACVVTISQAMRRALVGRGIDDSRIHVVPNAVGDEFLVPAPSKRDDLRRSLGIRDETVIGYVSNLSRREGHDVLIRAVARLHAAGRNVRCLIVGDGTIGKELRGLAHQLGIADRVVFTGEVDHQKIRGYYEAIDIFVVPRRADYAADYVTPLKPFEALALGRPLIMSDRPVAAEIVGNEERGLLFKTGDDEHLAATILRLLNDPDRRRSLVDAGRNWVETERTWRRNAEAYKTIYEDVLSGRRR